MSHERDVGTPGAKPTSPAVNALEHGEKALRVFVQVFAAGLGIGLGTHHEPAPRASDASTRLAQERTDLAMSRTYWAAQRTLMGWIRTALSMLSFGFTIGKLGQALEGSAVPGLRAMRMIGVDSVAYFLVILGTTALMAAAVQYSLVVHRLSEEGLRPRPSIAFAVALVLSLMGIGAFSSLALQL
jgi:putative membrane protein